MKPIAKDAAMWAAIMLAGVAGVALFKIAVASLPGPDGLNTFAASL